MSSQPDAMTAPAAPPAADDASPVQGSSVDGASGPAGGSGSELAPGWRLPTLRSPLAPDGALRELDQVARKGSLPGFAALPRGGESLRFRVAVFGEPFDRSLMGAVAPTAAGGSEVSFSVTLHRKAPAVLVVGTILAIWPGMPMLDKVIPPAWGWWPTWTWYLPLVILPTIALTPVLWKRSERAARDHAREQLARIADALRAKPQQGA